MSQKIWSHGNRMIPKGRNNYFAPEQWNFCCDECGLWWKSSQARKRWDNAIVCPICFEIRNPQDFLKGRPDRPAPPWTRPQPPILFVGDGTLSPTGSTTSSKGPAVGGDQMLVNGFLVNGKMPG